MRKLANSSQALCLLCQNTGAFLDKNGIVRCKRCQKLMLIDKKTKEVFEPVYEDETFQVNQYGAKVKDRRKNKRKMPILKERRNPQIFYKQRTI